MRFLLVLLIPFCLIADTGVDSDLQDEKGPWLTGPLLTASAYTIPKGHFNIEPYVFFIRDLGFFGSRGHVHLRKDKDLPQAINNVYICQLGLTEFIDINIMPQFTYNYGVGESQIGMGDLVVGPSFQLLREDKRFGGITFKLGLNQVFPCGRFENLNPVFSGNDGIGNGVWATKLYGVIAKTFHIYRENFLSTRAAFSSLLFVPVKIKGENFYGGDPTTEGRLTRGTSLILDLGAEFTITRNIALALDIENLFAYGSTFEGTTVIPVGNPKPTYMLSFAPALEYNWSKNFGIIAGIWVTGYGTNVEGFVNAVVAVNIYI